MRSSEILPYKKVCVRSDEDLARLPVLLTACLDYRKAASKLKELTIDFDGPGSLDEEAVESSPQDETPLVKAVRSLRLSQEVTQEVIEVVLQKRRGYLQNSAMAPLYGRLLADNKSIRLEAIYGVCAVLLALAENLETLRLQQPDWESSLCTLLKHNNDCIRPPQPYLQSLKHLHLASKYDDFLTDGREYEQLDIFEMLRCFHRLPNLESVTADGITDDFNGGDISSAIPPHVCSNLRSISVTHSSLGSLTLSALIRLPRPNTLEAFRATLGGRSQLGGGHPLTFARTIGKALETQKLSLRSIELDIGAHCSMVLRHADEDETSVTYEGREYLDDELIYAREDPGFRREEQESSGPYWAFDLPSDTKPYGATIGSLREFASLENLSVAVELLLGPTRYSKGTPPDTPFRLVDALPPTLKSFTLIDYQQGKVRNHDDAVDEFVRLRAGRFPRLTHVAGIDETVVGGRTVCHPDLDRDQLWKRVVWDGAWEIASRENSDDDPDTEDSDNDTH